jgi:hypothetical protein
LKRILDRRSKCARTGEEEEVEGAAAAPRGRVGRWDVGGGMWDVGGGMWDVGCGVDIEKKSRAEVEKLQ